MVISQVLCSHSLFFNIEPNYFSNNFAFVQLLYFITKYDTIHSTNSTEERRLPSSVLLTVLLKLDGTENNLNETLRALYAKAGEHTFEVRAAVTASGSAAPQILSVFQKSHELISYLSLPNISDADLLARESELARGKYILFIDGTHSLLSDGFCELLNYLGTIDSDIVFFDCMENGMRKRGGKDAFTEGNTNDFIIGNTSARLPSPRAAVKKDVLLRILPRARRLNLTDTLELAPLLFGDTAFYARTPVLSRRQPPAPSTQTALEQSIADALSLVDFFADVRADLEEVKYGFLFRYTRNAILTTYQSFILQNAVHYEKMRVFDAELHDKNMPLYLSAGERSIFSYVEKLRKCAFLPTKLYTFWLKTCLYAQP